MDRKAYTEANRAAWDQAAPIHRQSQFTGLLENFRRPGFNWLDSIATTILSDISVQGKDVIQLCCNNGRELLSVKNLGAGRCVGIDISDEFISQAKELNNAAQLDCEFVRSDVFEIPLSYNNQFDLTLITIGVLCWLPDLNPFFATISRLLREGGNLFIYEMHPALDMFENANPTDPLRIECSYFKTEPWIETDGLDYYENSSYQSSVKYCFHHKLSDILSSIIENGLILRSFQEYDHDISNIYSHFEEIDTKPPLCYSLVAEKSS